MEAWEYRIQVCGMCGQHLNCQPKERKEVSEQHDDEDKDTDARLNVHIDAFNGKRNNEILYSTSDLGSITLHATQRWGGEFVLPWNRQPIFRWHIARRQKLDKDHSLLQTRYLLKPSKVDTDSLSA